MSFREDLRSEGIVGQWMIDHFWTFLRGRRVEDLALQRLGVDVVITTRDGRSVNVDEKIKNAYGINNPPIRFPSVEIIQDCDTFKRGWWVNPDEKTDIYAYLNIYATNTDFHTLRYDQMTRVRAMVFSRQGLKVWLQKHIGNDQRIYRDAVQLAQDPERDRLDYIGQNGYVAHLKKSWVNRQHVVNLVVPAETIESIKGTRVYDITADGIQKNMENIKQ